MKKRNILKWIIFAIALAINLFIVVNSFVGGDASTNESNSIASGVASIINGISPGTINSSNAESFTVATRKIFGHLGLFALSGGFTTWAFYLFSKDTKIAYFLRFAGLSLFTGIFVAWLSEFIQVFMPGRSASASDVMIDAAGYLIGDLLVILVLFLAKKPIFKKEIQQEK